VRDAGASGSDFFDLATNLRRLATFERNLGYILFAFGIWCFITWRTGRETDRHGMIFTFLAGTFFFPFGALLALAGNTLKCKGRWRWLIQLLVVAWPLMFVTLFKWIL
jgi:hypothetical protein